MLGRSVVEILEYFGRYAADVAYIEPRGYRHERWTYGRVAESACQLARELESRGIHKGDHVVLWGGNSAEWVVAFFACMMRGIVAVPMDRVGSADFVRRVYQDVNAKMLIASSSLLPSAPGVSCIEMESIPALIAKHDCSPFAVALDRADTLQIIFTSGTTAEPRGVVVTHGNVLANLEPFENEIRKYLRYERIFHPIRFLSLVPLSHVFGQFMGMLIPPLIGGTVVFHDSLNPADTVRAIRRERVSVLVGVPRLLESLKSKIERDYEVSGRGDWFRRQWDLSQGEHFTRRWWRFRGIHRQFGWKFWAIVCGGATLPSEVEEFWRRLGFVVLQGYGLTETSSIISVNHPFRRGQGSIGKVLPGREMRLSDSGEILVRGENIAAGYWRRGMLTPVTGEAGWFHTGDIGELDAEGFLHFKGRLKNVIVTAEGMKVYPEDLEGALRAQPEVRDCVVFGASRNGNAEPLAVVIPRDGVASVEAAMERVNQSLASYQQIRRWRIWPDADFPRTSTHKPKMGEIRQAVLSRLEGAAVSPQASGTLAEFVALVKGGVMGDSAREARSDAALALTSIERVELQCAVEDRYQIDLDEQAFAEVRTLAELERLVQTAQSERTSAIMTPDEVPIREDGRGEAKQIRRPYRFPRWTQRWPVTWIRRILYYMLTWPATLLMAWPRVVGRERLRNIKGPFLVIANHVTFVDIGFVLMALPPRLRHKLAIAMEGERLQAIRHPGQEINVLLRPVSKLVYFLIVAIFNVFPLPQLAGFRESFEFAGESVDRGYSVLVFPEGMRTRDGKMAPFRGGIGMLASRLNLPVAPMRIDGLYELKMAGKRIAPPGAVRVAIGDPVHYEPKEDAEWITRDLERRVHEL